MTQTESRVLDIEHPAISWQAVSPASLDGPFLNKATGRYVPTERAQAFPIALQRLSTCPASSTDTAPYLAEARAQGGTLGAPTPPCAASWRVTSAAPSCPARCPT